MLPFPDSHKEITQQLINGKFILEDDKVFDIIRNADYREMYVEFFKKTFDYDLIIATEFIYLKSGNSKESLSRDFTIFLALLCRELYKDGKDFKREIETEPFEVAEVEKLLNESSKKEIIEHTTINKAKFIDYLNEWNRRNVIEFVNNDKEKFRFTKAVNLFFNIAKTIAVEKLKDTINVHVETAEQ
jgi:hypothetical protein